MSTWKYAWKSIRHDKRCNFALIAVMALVITIAASSLMIHASSTSKAQKAMQEAKPRVSITLDFDQSMGHSIPNHYGRLLTPAIPPVSTGKYLELADSAFLESSGLQLFADVIPSGLKLAGQPQTIEMSSMQMTSQSVSADSGAALEDRESLSYAARLIGMEEELEQEVFDKNLVKIVNGRKPESIGECLVSEEFASLNDLHIGDVFEMETPENAKCALTISGIYSEASMPGLESVSPFYEDEYTIDDDDRILVSFKTMEVLFDVDSLDVSSSLVLRNEKDLDAFENELRDKGLPEAYLVNLEEPAQKAQTEIDLAIAKDARTFFWTDVCIGILIVFGISFYTVRKRTDAIRVLRAIGVKRRQLIRFFLAQTAIISLISLGIGMTAGTAASGPAASWLNRRNEQAIQIREKEYSAAILDEDRKETYAHSQAENVRMTGCIAFELCLVAAVLGAVSSSAGVYIISKFDPASIVPEKVSS